MGCDSTTLQPFVAARFSAAPLYAPQDPAAHGGAVHGESLWLTGAASTALGARLGADAACCGRDDNDGGGGCGKCLLVRAPSSLEPSLTAVVMKKSFCPPGNALCSGTKLHIDIAGPSTDGERGTGFGTVLLTELTLRLE